MKTFVKIKDYPNWFWLVRSSEDVSFMDKENMHKRILSVVFKEGLDSIGEHINESEDFQKLKEYHHRTRWQTLAQHGPIDYGEIADKYNKPLLVRQIGSYMMLNDDADITDTIISEDFPLRHSKPDIVVCENDATAPQEWLDYLTTRFPDKTIEVINFFRDRSVESIAEGIRHAEFVTFSTTFTRYDWVNLLVGAMRPTHKVIGHCVSYDEWKTAKEYFVDHDLEIVKVMDTKYPTLGLEVSD
jgi:hypothetical protein